MDGTRPAVTGIGVATPIGMDEATFWDALITGRSGVAEVRSFDVSELPSRCGCEIHAALPADAGSGGRGRCTELALDVARKALADATSAGSRSGSSLDFGEMALVVGTTMGEVTRFERDRLLHRESEPGPADVRSLMERPLDVMARSVADALGVGGPVWTTPAACAAGSYAVGFAASLVRRGHVPAALAIGCEAFSRLAFVGFSRMRAMSGDVCRPFSLGRPGLLLGEGAGALLIRPWAAAHRSGSRIRGFVDGFGLSCDAHHVTAPHPDGRGAFRAMQDALSRADLTSAQVDYVNAHGTGTAHNDRMESRALRSLFGSRTGEVPVSSIKALTGHLMGAAGAVEAIASLLAMQEGLIPPTWNFVAPDPDCPIDCVPNAPRPGALRHVLSNSYAFGGNNASLLLTAPAA